MIIFSLSDLAKEANIYALKISGVSILPYSSKSTISKNIFNIKDESGGNYIFVKTIIVSRFTFYMLHRMWSFRHTAFLDIIELSFLFTCIEQNI